MQILQHGTIFLEYELILAELYKVVRRLLVTKTRAACHKHQTTYFVLISNTIP